MSWHLGRLLHIYAACLEEWELVLDELSWAASTQMRALGPVAAVQGSVCGKLVPVGC